jgi:hypothetical protein
MAIQFYNRKVLLGRIANAAFAGMDVPSSGATISVSTS